MELCSLTFPKGLGSFFLIILLIVNRKADIPESKLVKATIVLILALLVTEQIDDLLSDQSVYFLDMKQDTRVKLRQITSSLAYTLRPIVIMLELLIICPNKRLRIPIIIPAVINAFIYLPTMIDLPIQR